MIPMCRLVGLSPATSDVPNVLVAFPFAGGGPRAYADWARLFPPDVEFVGIDLPARFSRLREVLVNDLAFFVDEMARQLAPLLSRRVTVFGHSAGAVLAWACVDELWCRGFSVHRLVVSGAGIPASWDDERLDDLSRDELVDVLREAEGTPQAILESRELMDLCLPAIRSDLSLARQVRNRPPAGMDVPITVMGGTSDPRVAPADLEGWRAYSRGPVDVRLQPGGHFYFNDELARFVTELALLAG
jgi:medium-chain acyl-[acyl-carrier-protein] hydrolase